MSEGAPFAVLSSLILPDPGSPAVPFVVVGEADVLFFEAAADLFVGHVQILISI